MAWSAGDWVVRREVLTEGVWFGLMVRIIEDTPEYLVSYIPPRSPFGFPDGNWPTPDGKHPWWQRSHWQGHGCLMIQRPGEAHAIWHFWQGPARDFLCWYINLQEPFRRTAVGYDSQDLELDYVVYPDGRWQVKDADVMDLRVQEGRWSAERVAEICRDGEKIAARLDAGERWWPASWRDWEPDPSWEVPTALPAGWAL